MRRSNHVFGIFCLASIYFLSASAQAVEIKESEFCVTQEAFFFDVVVQNGTAVVPDAGLQIDASFNSSDKWGESFFIHYDSTSGKILETPEVTTAGLPPYSRWQDGPVTDISVAKAGTLTWRISGSIPHGSAAFGRGDDVDKVTAGDASGTAIEDDVLIDVCGSEPFAEIRPTWVTTGHKPVPTLDGVLNEKEWTYGGADWADDRNLLTLENGWINFEYDANRLYVLINMLDDDGNDSLPSGGNDQFWLIFDVDEDGFVTPGVDKRYRLEESTGNLRSQTFADCGPFCFGPLESKTYSARAEGFSCSPFDGSAGPRFCRNHRYWELAIDLDEIGMLEDGSTRFAVRVVSGNPAITEQLPASIGAVEDYALLQVGQSWLADGIHTGDRDLTPDFEVTQAIQTPDNELDLVAGKPTLINIWDSGVEARTRIVTFASQEGVDCVGSPWVRSHRFERITSNDNPRTHNKTSTRMQLSKGCSAAGTTDFNVEVLGGDRQILAAKQASIDFVRTSAPVYWTVPVRNVVTVVEEPRVVEIKALEPGEIAIREEFARQILPLMDIDYVRRPLLQTKEITRSEEMLDVMREYSQQVDIAWNEGVAATGVAPFKYPAQITAFHKGGLKTEGGGAGGSSDPTWYDSGAGIVTWVSTNNSRTSYPHELNHNLDRGVNGTYGTHVGDCDSGTQDPSWPYEDDTIQETGFWWDGTTFNPIGFWYEDFMSYCAQPGVPDSWISPYRWEHWLDNFRRDPVVASAAAFSASASSVASGPVDSFYVLGRVYPDGTGTLGQVLRRAGSPSVSNDSGEYRVSVFACNGERIGVQSFSPSFRDVEGNSMEFSGFSFVLPAPAAACRLELSRGPEVIEDREISAGAPVVNLITPNGGEELDGIQRVEWVGSDPDGDSLLYTLHYSTDGGVVWLPIASRLTDTFYDLDTTALPGSENARVRVLVTDGANTASDESEASFFVAEKPPTAVILAPANGGVYQTGTALTLTGQARDLGGAALPEEQLNWYLDGQWMGSGNGHLVTPVEGPHEISLMVGVEDEFVAGTSIQILIAGISGGDDEAGDVGNGTVDLIRFDANADDDYLRCELTVNSGDSALSAKNQYKCMIDFDDWEQESVAGCDATGNGILAEEYALGFNNHCDVEDITLKYRVSGRGGSCNGSPGVTCETIETAADGTTDDKCDGKVGGQDGATCTITLIAPVTDLVAVRDTECDGERADECFGGTNDATGQFQAFVFAKTEAKRDHDRIPATDDGEQPNELSEVLQIALTE